MVGLERIGISEERDSTESELDKQQTVMQSNYSVWHHCLKIGGEKLQVPRQEFQLKAVNSCELCNIKWERLIEQPGQVRFIHFISSLSAVF